MASCIIGEITIEIDEDTGEATVDGELTNCLALWPLTIASATISGEGSATVISDGLLVVNTTDTVTWNTGHTTTMTTIREIVGFSTVVDAGEEAVVSGLFNPSAAVEAGTGVRTNPGDAPGISQASTDRIVVSVQNNLSDFSTIHWTGIF